MLRCPPYAIELCEKLLIADPERVRSVIKGEEAEYPDSLFAKLKGPRVADSGWWEPCE